MSGGILFNATFNNISVTSWCKSLTIFISDLRQVGDIFQVFRFFSTNKTDRHDITEILLKVAFNTINPLTNEKKKDFILLHRKQQQQVIYIERKISHRLRPEICPIRQKRRHIFCLRLLT
jgi:hypothetical protein